MKKILAVVLMLAGAAWAGTVAADSAGGQPTLGTEGISLKGVVGVRMSIRVDGGGNIYPGCTLVPWYMDDNTGKAISSWTEADSTLRCVTAAWVDGGVRDSFICPDLTPAARYGRMAVSKYGCIGWDGGSGSANSADGGPLSQPIVRIEGWGPAIPGDFR